MEFLEEAYKVATAVGQGRRESGGGPSTPTRGKTSNANKEGGGREEGEGEEREEEDEKETCSDSEGVGKSSLGRRGRDTRASAAEPPGGSSSGLGGGFGVVGEGETVELALQALSKVRPCVRILCFSGGVKHPLNRP